MTRKKKPTAHEFIVGVWLKATPEQRALMTEAAARRGLDPIAWMTEAALAEAAKVLDDELVVEDHLARLTAMTTTRTCDVCGGEIAPSSRRDKRTCSDACRKAKSRGQLDLLSQIFM